MAGHRFFPVDNGLAVFATDITDRKRAEEALRESETRYRTLVENIGVGISLIDSKHNIVMSNSTVGNWVGAPASGLRGKKCFQVFRRREAVCPGCQGVVAMTTGHAAESEFEHLRADGTLAHVHLQAFPLHEPDGEPKGFIEVVTDITERKKTEEELRRSQEMLELALTGADLGLWNLDVQTGQAVVNERAANMAGYSLDEIDPTLGFFFDLVHPDDRSRVSDSLENNWRGRTDLYEAEYRVLAKSGDWKWILSRGKVVERGENGSPLRMAGTFMDITDRKYAEKELSESEARFKQVADSLNEWIWEVDANGMYTYCSSAAERILGYSRDELVGQKHFYDLFAPEVREDLKEVAMAACSRREPIKNFVNPNVHKNGDISNSGNQRHTD